MSTHIVGLLGILIALGLLIFLAFRGFTLLLAAPAAAIVAAIFSGEPLLAKWTITFMRGAALFIARGITERLGNARAVMAVVLACAALTYGGVSRYMAHSRR